MVKVYPETPNTAELVAIFEDEETYERCFPALERFANEIGMFVTESINSGQVGIIRFNKITTF